MNWEINVMIEIFQREGCRANTCWRYKALHRETMGVIYKEGYGNEIIYFKKEGK